MISKAEVKVWCQFGGEIIIMTENVSLICNLTNDTKKYGINWTYFTSEVDIEGEVKAVAEVNKNKNVTQYWSGQIIWSSEFKKIKTTER